MTEPYKVSKSSAIAAVAAVLPGPSPAIRLIYHSENSRGVAREFIRQVAVPDAGLFRRIQTNIQEGEQIEATTVNEWYDNGYTSYLTDFKKLTPVEQETPPKNGTSTLAQLDFVKNEITQITILPVRNPKAKVRH